MTYLEKARELRPDLTDKDILDGVCPDSFLKQFTVKVNCKHGGCIACWDTEIPNKNNELEETKL